MVLDRAVRVVATRAAGGGLAWAAYDDVGAWCDAFTAGRIRWLPAGEAAPITVGPVQSGCLCCGAYWPALQIDLGPAVVAWSYAGDREGPAVGVARRSCGIRPSP
ncbi:MAG: hypothetical protein R3F60_17185 [bacterium]